MTKNKRYFKKLFFILIMARVYYIQQLFGQNNKLFCDIYMVMALVDFILYLYGLHNE